MHLMQFVELGYNPIMKVQFNISRSEEITWPLFWGDAEETANFDPDEYLGAESTHEQCSIKIFNGSVSKEIVFHKKRSDKHSLWKMCDQHHRRDFPSREQLEHLIEYEIWDSQSELEQMEKTAKSEENCLSYVNLLVELWQNDDYISIECLLQETDLSVPEDPERSNIFLTNMHNIGKDILIFDWSSTD